MVQSNQAYVKSGQKSTSASAWQELLKINIDPNQEIHIREITIKLNAYMPTTSVHIKVEINGEDAISDLEPVDVTTTLSFGGDLVFNGKRDTGKNPILIKVHSDGTTTIYATAIVTGIQTSI